MAQSKAGSEMIISKARTKALVKKCNVGGDFYDALDAATRDLIRKAEERALGNKRKTLKAVDVGPSQSKPGSEMIISKARTKALVKKCNVGGDFYDALDAATRDLIRKAEERALGNKRKTLKAVDV
ncbi:MAG: hypothetical protein OXU53_03570 [Deltaproteobacteria bacterium]|nr:hypothetical protein [Deltaproteobacteria bacterium]MDD9872879.1 hypothetical protein [Deltaproteobacteria bacterium]